MSFKFELDETPGDGIKRMAIEQIDQALAEHADPDLNRHDTVHQVRKRCKKIRSLLRLARGELEDHGETYSHENACYRDAARELSYIRDAAALLETYDLLMESYGKQVDRQRMGLIRGALTRRRQRVVDDIVALDAKLDTFAKTLQAARNRVEDWPLERVSFKVLKPGLVKTYGRARTAMKKARRKPTTERYHEWRKRTKYHRYHIRVLRPVWPSVMNEWRHDLHSLSDYLGDDHDLAVFGNVLRHEVERFPDERDVQTLLGLTDRKRAEIQALAYPLGKRLLTEKPKHLAKRVAACWNAAHSDAERGTPAVNAEVAIIS